MLKQNKILLLVILIGLSVSNNYASDARKKPEKKPGSFAVSSRCLFCKQPLSFHEESADYANLCMAKQNLKTAYEYGIVTHEHLFNGILELETRCMNSISDKK